MPYTSEKRTNNNITFAYVMCHDLISEDVLFKENGKTVQWKSVKVAFYASCLIM